MATCLGPSSAISNSDTASYLQIVRNIIQKHWGCEGTDVIFEYRQISYSAAEPIRKLAIRMSSQMKNLMRYTNKALIDRLQGKAKCIHKKPLYSPEDFWKKRWHRYWIRPHPPKDNADSGSELQSTSAPYFLWGRDPSSGQYSQFCRTQRSTEEACYPD